MGYRGEETVLMQARRAQVAIVVVALAALACGPAMKKSTGGTSGGDDGVRTATPLGTPVSRTVSATISPSGGTLASADGSLKIVVPAGAVSSSTVLTLTPIANTAHGAVGGAFRLGPEGTTFAVPVLLTFKAPDKYPPGTSIAGVGVEYQDRLGFWHKVDVVSRSTSLNTISVSTNHFSDWALTWQTTTAAAEGPIKLIQTVGVPFTAYGQASVFLLGDDDSDTSYLLTGTLTVPDTIAVGNDVCVPDQTTKALPLSIAEIHKGYPAVFRWGIAVSWSLSCTAADGSVTTRLMPALFDTMYINLTQCGGYYDAGQVASATQMEGGYTKNCGLDGLVNATWSLQSCVADVACQVADATCHSGVTACTNGIASCVDTGPAPNGTVCGDMTGADVCSVGQCVALNDQSIGVTVAPTTGLTTTEAGGTATFTLVLNKQPTIDVTIGISSSDTAEGTVSPSSVTFTPQNWNAAQTVTVTGVGDFIADGDHTYDVVLAPAVSIDPRYSGYQVPPVQLVNVNNNVAGFVVNPTSGLVTSEAGQSATFTIVLTSQPLADVTVPLSSSNPSQGAVSPASVTFNATNWNVAQTVTVTGVDDHIVNGDQTYSVLTAPAVSADAAYNGLDGPDVRVTNMEFDVAGVTVTPTSGLVTTELGGAATFTVVLTSMPVADVVLSFVSSDASQGVVSPASVTFNAASWDVPQTVTVTGVHDFIAHGANQAYTVSTAVTSADPIYNGHSVPVVSLTNTEIDVAGITVSRTSGLVTTEAGGTDNFTMVLTSKPQASVTIPLSSSNPSQGTVSPASVTFDATNWNIAQTVTVTGVDDHIFNGDQPYTVVTGAAISTDLGYSGLDPVDVSVTNTEKDVASVTVSPASGLVTTELGGTATFTVVLTSIPSADVMLTFTSSDTSQGVVSPATVTLNASNWNVPQPVAVTGVRDFIAQSGGQSYTVSTAVTSADPNYNAKAVPTVSLTNTEVDVAGVTLSPTSGLVTTELGGTATFTAVLTSKPIASVVLTFTSSDTSQGVVSPTSVTFDATNWNVAQTVTVTGVHDFIAQSGSQPYTVSTAVASADPTYNGKAVPALSLTNTEVDVAGVTLSPTSGLVTTELGGTATFTAVLTSKPVADVVLSFTSSNPSQGVISPTSVTFNATNWNVAQAVTVTGVDDFIVNGDQPYSVSTSVASGDPSYGGIAVPVVSLTNTEKDVAGIPVNPTSVTIPVANGTAVFDVVLQSQPTADVTIPVATNDATQGLVSTGTSAPATSLSLTFTAANWNVPQQVTITAQTTATSGFAYPIVLSPAVSADSVYSGMKPADVAVTNLF
jgi:hypothetical protein